MYKLFVVSETGQSTIDFNDITEAEDAYKNLKKDKTNKVTKLYSAKAVKDSFITMDIHAREGCFKIRAKRIKKRKAIQELKLGTNLFPINFFMAPENCLIYDDNDNKLYLTQYVRIGYDEDAGLIYSDAEWTSWDGKDQIDRAYIPDHIEYIYMDSIKILKFEDNNFDITSIPTGFEAY